MNLPDGFTNDPDLLTTLRAVGFPAGSYVLLTSDPKLASETALNGYVGEVFVVTNEVSPENPTQPAGKRPYVWVKSKGAAGVANFWMLHDAVVAWKPGPSST